MGKVNFKLTRIGVAAPCPKCGNTQNFVGRSAQVAEDCCDVWVTCRCGYDPTADETAHRMEDIWGSLDPATLSAALECTWNELVETTVSEESKHVD